MDNEASTARLGRKCFVSQRGLQEILTWAKEHPEELQEAGTSRSSLKRTRENALKECAGPYGSIVKTMKVEAMDGKFSLSYLCPAASLYHASLRCKAFGSFLFDLLASNEPSIRNPWNLCLYADEVSPGNQLKVHNARKLWTIYWSLKEFGGKPLTQETAWFVWTVLRTDSTNNLKDTVSQLFKACAQSFFLSGQDFSIGFPLEFEGGARKVMVATIGYVLGDEPALKHIYENKGSAGKMPCLLCRNVVNKRYAPHHLGNLILHTELDAMKFVKHTDRSIWKIVDILAIRQTELSKGEFKDYQSNVGFNYAPYGILRDVPLRAKLKPVTATCFDPMHVYLVGGLFHNEMTALMAELGQHGINQARTHTFVNQWTWPAAVRDRGVSGKSLFAKKFDGDFKSSASEALSLYPVLREFVAQITDHRLKMACNSFKGIALVLDNLRLASAGKITGDDLHASILTHLQAFKAAYGEDRLVPKAHYAMHLAEQLKAHGILLTCFVHERRHKEIKRFANQMATGVAGVETSLLKDLFLNHTLDLINFDTPSVGNWTQCPPELSVSFANHLGLLILEDSLEIGLWSHKIKRGDVVVTENPSLVGEVNVHFKYGADFFSLICVYNKVQTNMFRKSDDIVLIDTTQILGACIHHWSGEVCKVAPHQFWPKD